MTTYTIRIAHPGQEPEVLDITEAVADGTLADRTDPETYAHCLWENFADANPGADVDLRIV